MTTGKEKKRLLLLLLLLHCVCYIHGDLPAAGRRGENSASQARRWVRLADRQKDRLRRRRERRERERERRETTGLL